MAEPVVALLPWGEVIEDFLDSIDLSLDDFLETMSGGWLFGYVEALATAGVRSTIVCTSTAVDRPTRRVHAPTGAPVWLLPAGRVQARLRRSKKAGDRLPQQAARWATPWLATPPRAFARVLRDEGVTAILCQEYSEARFTVSLAVGRMLHVPVFATFQGGVEPPTGPERATRALSLRRAAGFVVGSSPEVQRLQREYDVPLARIHRIPNPLRLADWPVGDRALARRSLGLPDRAFVVAWHGRVETWRKGIDVLVDAWDGAASTVPGARERVLLLVGTGPDREALHERVDDRDDVRWTDDYMLDRTLIRTHLAAADVAVLPSRHEGFPVALLEMMASGRAVVATDVPGVHDIAPAGEEDGCVVVPAGDVEALSSALRRLADDGALRDRLATQGRRRVESGFSFESVGRSLADVLAPG